MGIFWPFLKGKKWWSSNRHYLYNGQRETEMLALLSLFHSPFFLSNFSLSLSLLHSHISLFLSWLAIHKRSNTSSDHIIQWFVEKNEILNTKKWIKDFYFLSFNLMGNLKSTHLQSQSRYFSNLWQKNTFKNKLSLFLSSDQHQESDNIL